MPLLDDITLGRYHPGDSLIHRLDPRTKGFCALTLMMAVFGIQSFWGIVFGMAAVLSLVISSGVGFSGFLKNLRAFFWLFLLTFLLHLLFSPASEIVELPLLKIGISLEGLNRGIFYSCRIAFLLAFSYLFMAVTSPMEIAGALEKILKPFARLGFPAGETSLAVSIALRFVPTLLDEARRIRDAQLCRGAKLEGNLYQKISGFSAMLIPLFVSAMRRADTLALTLEARGYRGSEGRSSYVRMSFGFNDAVAISGALIISLILILL